MRTINLVNLLDTENIDVLAIHEPHVNNQNVIDILTK